MMDRLTETLLQARNAAVEERAREHGPCYMSPLEGYGDMVRKLCKTQASTKEVKGKLERLSALMDVEDPQPMQECLTEMETRAAAVCYNALRMYAAVRTMMATVHAETGGDLLDYLEEMPDEAGEHDS